MEFLCLGFQPFVISHFNITVLSLCDCFQWIVTRPHGWQVGLPHSPTTEQIPLSSVKPCFSSSRVVCFVHRAVRFSFNHSMYFKQQKCLCVLLKMNIHAFIFSKVIFYFVSSSKKQMHILLWKWIPMFMTVLLVPINPLVLKVAYSQHPAWRWQNQTTTTAVTMNVQSKGWTFTSHVFCRVQWAFNSSS
jgi:hypothetical protein